MNAIERQIVTALLDRAEAEAWPLLGVHDGEEFHTTDPSKHEHLARADVVALLDDLDDAHLTFGSPSGRRAVARLIFGNGCDVLSDYTLTPGFEELLKPVNDLAESLG